VWNRLVRHDGDGCLACSGLLFISHIVRIIVDQYRYIISPHAWGKQHPQGTLFVTHPLADLTSPCTCGKYVYDNQYCNSHKRPDRKVVISRIVKALVCEMMDPADLYFSPLYQVPLRVSYAQPGPMLAAHNISLCSEYSLCRSLVMQLVFVLLLHRF
jgi:hypothetical protein